MSTNIYKEKNTLKAVLAAAIPAMLGQIATLIYNIADTYFVSLTKNPAQIAAVTLCTPILLMIMSIANIFGSGGSSLIARLLGADDKQQVKSVTSYCFYGMLILGILVLIIGLIATPALVTACGADSQNATYTADYLQYIFIGAPFIMLGNGMLNIFRSVGLIREGTIGLFIGNGTNVVLDFVFIVLLHMGTTGAALATSIGFLFTTIYYIICMRRTHVKGNGLMSLAPKDFHPSISLTAQVFQIGIPGALITILISISGIVMNNYISVFGSDAVAAYGIANKIIMIPIMLSVGLSQGIAPLIGYYYGSKELPRLKSTMLVSNIFGVIMGTVFAVIFFFAGSVSTGFFLSDPNLIQLSTKFLHILCISSPAIGIINLVTAYFQALGKALPSLAITISRNVILFISAVILFNHLWGLSGVMAAQPTVEIIMALICIVLYTASIQKLSKHSQSHRK